MSDLKPVWLLDVDGVLNTYGSAGSGGEQRTGVAYADSEKYTMHWDPDIVQTIGQWHCDGRVEVVWSTTWCPFARQIEQLFGLPEFGTAWTEDVRGTAASRAKRNVVLRYSILGRRIIWTDDTEVDPRSTDFRALTEAGHLLIRPNWRKGLERHHLTVIDQFLKKEGF